MAEEDPWRTHEPMWTEDTWREFSDYADQVTVEVRFKAWAGAQDEDEAWVLRSHGAAWPRDWLSRELAEIAASGDGGCCGSGTFMLDVRERHTEWGASGSVWEATLTLAEAMLASGTWAALGVLGEKLRRKLTERDGEWEGAEELLVDEFVRQEAIRVVAQLRGLDFDSLRVIGAESSGKDSATIEVRDEAGAVYRVEVQERQRVMRARVRKITDP